MSNFATFELLREDDISIVLIHNHQAILINDQLCRTPAQSLKTALKASDKINAGEMACLPDDVFIPGMGQDKNDKI